jgi:hypothetical protein
MFLLSLFGNHRIYSTQQLAEQNASTWLRKFVIDNHWLWGKGGSDGGITAEYRKQFEAYFQREDFAGCVRVWNTYAKDILRSNYPYYSGTITVVIKDMKVDERFI